MLIENLFQEHPDWEQENDENAVSVLQVSFLTWEMVLDFNRVLEY